MNRTALPTNRTSLPMKWVTGRLYLQSINFIFLPFQGNYNSQDVHQPDDCSWHPGQTIIIPHDEQAKKWQDLDDDRREQLKVQTSLILNLYQSLTTRPDRRWAFGRCRHY
jgi:hypothetical protein